jgi:hypothetical protein
LIPLEEALADQHRGRRASDALGQRGEAEDGIDVDRTPRRRIRDAEEYMEIRRLLFVENGYPIRKLNQAYFAFHGSYGTAPAASSPIGPKMEELRSLTPDVPTFLRVVRGFTSPEDLDRALEEWRASASRQGTSDPAIRVSGLPVVR